MGILDVFKKKPQIEKIKGDVCAKAGYKPFVTIQLFEGMDSQYVYLVGNQFVAYEIGKYDTSNINTYKSKELASEGMMAFLEHCKSLGFTNLVHPENGAHNALVENGVDNI